MINVMTYDFHGSWDPMTGECSPLFKGPEDQGGFIYFNVVSMSFNCPTLVDCSYINTSRKAISSRAVYISTSFVPGLCHELLEEPGSPS